MRLPEFMNNTPIAEVYAYAQTQFKKNFKMKKFMIDQHPICNSFYEGHEEIFEGYGNWNHFNSETFIEGEFIRLLSDQLYFDGAIGYRLTNGQIEWYPFTKVIYDEYILTAA
jgi:hypothetical protein